MNVISIPIVVIASISFFVGLNHLSIYIQQRQSRVDLTFAVMCIAYGFYDVFCAGLYNAASVAEGAQWQRMQFIVLAFFNVAFLWFVSYYTHQKPQKAIFAFTIFYSLAALVQVIDRSNLTWLIDQPAIKKFILPFGIKVTYFEATLGVFTTIQGLMGLVVGVYIFWNGIRFYMRGYKREAVPLLIALGFVYAAAINDTAISDGLYRFIYTIEYGYMAMILLMDYPLSRIIAEATRTKKSLIESEERYRTIVENSHSGIFTINNFFQFTYVNDQLCNILGYSREELIGKDFRLFLDDESKEKVVDNYIRRQRGEIIEPRYELKVIRKDSNRRILEMSAATTALSSADIRSIGQVLDITERKQAEEALQQANLVVENSPVVLFRWGTSEGWPIELVSANVTLLGYSADELVSDAVHFSTLVHPQDEERIRREVQDYSNRGVDKFKQEYRLVTQQGDVRWVDDHTSIVKDTAGQITNYQGIVIDITERKQAEAERENLIKELEIRNAELERFTYIVSHDLRSPLVTIRGFLGYLEKNVTLGNTGQVKDDLHRIATATNKMQRMLNELLELSRIGRIMNPHEEFGLVQLVQEGVDQVRMQIEARGVQVNIAKNLPTVNGDRARLLEVIQNLLDNACKFMGDQPNPIIEIGMGGIGPGSEPIFYVRDNGIGIDPQFHERIFGLFNKLDVHTEGTGVGLALVKRIIEDHGGRVWVESLGKGQGSTFYFSLPATQAN